MSTVDLLALLAICVVMDITFWLIIRATRRNEGPRRAQALGGLWAMCAFVPHLIVVLGVSDRYT